METKISIIGLPGTGKTTSLMRLIDHRIEDVRDAAICTFRREMAAEIKNRIQRKYELRNRDLPNIGTIHALCKRMLGIADDQIITPDEMKIYTDKFGVDYDEQKGGGPIDPAEMSSERTGNLLFDVDGWLRNTLHTSNDINEYLNYDRLSAQIDVGIISEFQEGYREYKKKIGKIDFTDLLENTLDEKISPPTSSLIVDEFQDLTPIQYELFGMWSERADLTIIAGDPYQCIYSFWGADPGYLTDFKADENIILPITYRFGAEIWNFAIGILKNAGYNDIPEIQPHDKASGKVEIVDKEFYALNCISNSNESTMHLVRCGYMAYSIAKKLIAEGIPFVGVHGWNEKQILMYQALRTYKTDNYMTKAGLVELIDVHPASFFKFDKETLKNKISSNKKTFYSEKDIFEFTAPLSNYVNENFLNSLKFPACLVYADISDTTRTKLLTALNRNAPVDHISVYLGTIHSVKGREADNVFVWDETNRTIRNTMSNRGHEEESRVWFVASTRARKRLCWVESNGYNSWDVN